MKKVVVELNLTDESFDDVERIAVNIGNTIGSVASFILNGVDITNQWKEFFEDECGKEL